MRRFAALWLLLLASFAASPHKPARVEYVLRVDTTDLSGIGVEIRIANAPANLHLAAHAHPEYDDKYWRYLRGFAATTPSGAAIAFTRADSVVWHLQNAPGDVLVRYRVHLPRTEGMRDAWKPFLEAGGGLVGGPHSFLYVVGAEDEPTSVTLDIPHGWRVASGLPGPPTARTFAASDMYELLEAPMLVGDLREWGFGIQGVRHRVFYLPGPASVPFDTAAWLSGIEKLAAQTVQLFGGMPYREYTFLLHDGAYEGGLEHPNSVTLGVSTPQLARDPHAGLEETAHEFVHTWNLMAIRPAEYRKVDYRVQPPVAGLWFSEGLTLFYADLLLRRAGLRAGDSTRPAHTENLIARYLSAPGNSRFSAETVSRVAYNAPPDALGDYTASSHLQGELLGMVLDLLVRDSTDGARSMDDVMRLMYGRFTDRGFTGADVEEAVNERCACNTAAFFNAHVRGAGIIDFDKYFAPLGFRVHTTWGPAMRDGRPLKDLRLWSWQEPNETLIRLRVGDPSSVWGRAGVRTGDRLVSINGAPMRSWPELRTFLSSFAIGASAVIVVQRDERPVTIRVTMRGHDSPSVRLIPIEDATDRQLRLRKRWLAGN